MNLMLLCTACRYCCSLLLKWVLVSFSCPALLGDLTFSCFSKLYKSSHILIDQKLFGCTHTDSNWMNKIIHIYFAESVQTTTEVVPAATHCASPKVKKSTPAPWRLHQEVPWSWQEPLWAACKCPRPVEERNMQSTEEDPHRYSKNIILFSQKLAKYSATGKLLLFVLLLLWKELWKHQKGYAVLQK